MRIRAWLRALAQPFTYLGLALLVVIGVALALLIDQENRSVYQAALTKSEADARVFEEFIARTIKSADDKLLLLRRAYQQDPENFDLASWTRGFASGNAITPHFALVGRDGIIKATTLGALGLDVGKRGSFRELAAAADDRLVIARPHQLATGKWAIALSRRLIAPDGTFAGCITTLLDPQQLEPFYRSINLGSDGIVSLLGTDGYIRARGSADGLSQPETFGKSIAKAPVFERIATARSGSYWNVPGTVDPVSRLITYRALADYPLIAIIGRSTEEIYRSAAQTARLYLGIALFIAFGIVASVTVAAARQRKVHAAHATLEATNRRFDTALENIAHGLCMFDVAGSITVVNRQFLDMYRLDPQVVRPGCTLRALIDQRIAAGLLTGDPEAHRRRILETVAEGHDRIVRMQQSDGRMISILDRPLPDGGWITIHRDVTQEVKGEAELEETRNFLNTIIAEVPSCIVVKDARDLRYALINRAAERFMGRPAAEVIGRTSHEIYPAKTAATLQQLDDEILKSADGRQRLDDVVPFHDAPNGAAHIAIDRVVVNGSDGQPKYILGVVNDMTERKRSEAQIYHMAHHDALTGLANRVLFLKSVDEALARLRRHGDAFNILVLDLDQFKTVNDTLGHPVGDLLLKEAAARLTACTRETDIVARLGGDEFAILQRTDGAQGEQALALARRLLEAIHEPFRLDGSTLVVGTSIGVALAPQDGDSAEHLLKNADLALYQAKAEGRHRCRLFDAQMEAQARARHELEIDLRGAIWRDEFELHYQTVVDSGTREVSGVEALVRWRHPQRGLLGPDAFIPLAEETGLIVPLGEWILRRACLDAASWPAHIRLAVNLSATQFTRPDLKEIVAQVLSQTGLAPGRLELEITESVLLQNDDVNVALLHALRSLGVAIVLDDFGTGYSSLSYLQKFPFDKLKIDRSFVSELSSRNDSAAIVCAINSLGKTLNIRTTAEGIETEEQFRLLRATGIDQMQGYLFSRPRPKAELDFTPVPEVRAGQAA